MAAENFVSEAGGVDVQVNLGRGDGLVAEHHLYGAQIVAAFEQMRGKGMAQGVRRHVFANTTGLGGIADDVEHHHTAHGFASMA